MLLKKKTQYNTKKSKKGTYLQDSCPSRSKEKEDLLKACGIELQQDHNLGIDNFKIE